MNTTSIIPPQKQQDLALAKRAVLIAQRDLARVEHDIKHIELNAEVDRLSKAHDAIRATYQAQYAEFKIAFDLSTEPSTRTSENIARTRALLDSNKELADQVEIAWTAWETVAKARSRSWTTYRRSQAQYRAKIDALDPK